MDQTNIPSSDEPNNFSIGQGLIFPGWIYAKGKAEISETVTGQIKVDELGVGASGVVSGRISTREMSVLGIANDKIDCAKYACIHTTGEISEKLIDVNLEIKKGNRIIGFINRRDD